MSEDVALAALIVRNIGDIEAALSTAQNQLDKRFFDEVEQATQASSDQIWNVKYDRDEDDVRLTKQDWPSGEDEDFCLQFGELAGANGETEWTWIATSTGSGPNGATFALIFKQKSVTEARLKQLLSNHPELTTRLRERGFKRDESGKQLFTPITIDREALAQAFEKDDFDVALEPIQTAVKTASAAVKELDELVRLIRSQAAR